jgi:hypothetical protein
MSKRRNCSFNDDFRKEFEFIKPDKLCSDGTRVVCQHFNFHFPVAHGGRSDINQHLRSQKHKDAEKTLASVKHISSFMVRRDGDSESDKIAASEVLVAYHTVCHGQSFRANECLSTFIKKIYEPKFSSARTRSEAIITISLTERDNISATEVSMNIENLVNNLESRKSGVFGTTDVTKQLKMLVDSGEIIEA